MPGQKEVPHMITYIWVRIGMKPGVMYAVHEGWGDVGRPLRKLAFAEPGLRFVTYDRLTDAMEVVRVAARSGGGRWAAPLLICANDPWRYDTRAILNASRWLQL